MQIGIFGRLYCLICALSLARAQFSVCACVCARACVCVCVLCYLCVFGHYNRTTAISTDEQVYNFSHYLSAKLASKEVGLRMLV